MAHFHCFVQQDSMQCGIAAYKWYANIMAESIRPTFCPDYALLQSKVCFC